MAHLEIVLCIAKPTRWAAGTALPAAKMAGLTSSCRLRAALAPVPTRSSCFCCRMERDVARAVTEAAHQVCPYSTATAVTSTSRSI
jgi:hypothetical protein